MVSPESRTVIKTIGYLIGWYGDEDYIKVISKPISEKK